MEPKDLIPNPYANLYIYYFEGVPTDTGTNLFGKDFIGNWEEDGYSFIFFSSPPAPDFIKNLVAKNPAMNFIDQYEMSCEEWHGDKIESYRAGTLCISPPWKIPFINDPGLKHILLDPGVVFGTGRHPTTESCLEYIEFLCKKEKISTVLDMGTGTGLLALGAASLGCKKILALDFNLLAVKTALNNIRLNSFENVIIPVQAKAEDLTFIPADLVIANIHYDVMKNILCDHHFFKKKWFILSGLLKSETEKIIRFLKKKPVEIIDHSCPDGIWNTILGKTRT